MPDEENTFRKIDRTDDERYGERALLLIGYSRAESETIGAHVEAIGAGSIRRLLATNEMVMGTVAEAFAVADQPDDVEPADLPRFVILSGLTGAEIHKFLDSYRQTGLPRPIFATSTPNNQSFTLRALLTELAAEHVEMMKLREQQMNKKD